MRAATAVAGWLGVGALAAACSTKPADGVGSSELPAASAPPLASAPPISSASASSSSPPPRAPRRKTSKGEVCHIVDDGPHRVAFAWSEAELWHDIEPTSDERTFLARDDDGAGYKLKLVDGKMLAERDTRLEGFDDRTHDYRRSIIDAPRRGPWGKGEVRVDALDNEISIWFPGQARQRLHEISWDDGPVTFASHASGVAIVGFSGKNEEDPFIFRWSKGNARRRVRESFPGTGGAPDVVVGPDGTPWLMVTHAGESHERTFRVLKLVKSRWLKLGEWKLDAFSINDMAVAPGGAAWVLLGNNSLNDPKEQGGLWRLPAGGRKWERIAPKLIGPCRPYSTELLIPIAKNRLMMWTRVLAEGATSCEVRGWATVELRLDDAIDPAFAARCASLPAPARRGASP